MSKKSFLDKLNDAIHKSNDSEESSEFIKRINDIHEAADKKSDEMKGMSEEEMHKKLDEISGVETDSAEFQEELKKVETDESMQELRKEEAKMKLIADIENKKSEVKLYKAEIENYMKIVEKNEEIITELVKGYEDEYGEYKGLQGIGK